MCIRDSIYPNPLTNESVISFSVKNESFVTLEIVDVQGKTISKPINEYLLPKSYSIDLANNLANGVYLLKGAVNGSLITKKFVVNN